MRPPVAAWGRRLTDAVRAAVDARDIAGARRLVVDGDGQARSLATEYTLMYKSLGVTIRAMLPLLGATASAAPESDRAGARTEVVALVRAFRRDMTRLMIQAYGPDTVSPPASGEAADIDGACAAIERLLDAGEARFAREQARIADDVVRALDGGDADGARALVDAKERAQYLPLHDRLVRFMAESFGWVLRRGGGAALVRFHLATAEGQRRGFEKWDAMTAEDFAWATAFLIKQHMGALEVSEDAEKFTLAQAPCGSGGRLRLAGAYDGPDALPFVEEAGALTFGEARLPVYCSHCPVWNGVAPLRWFGRPHWVFDDPARADGSCTLHVYKRRDGAPGAYARRLGVDP